MYSVKEEVVGNDLDKRRKRKNKEERIKKKEERRKKYILSLYYLYLNICYK